MSDNEDRMEEEQPKSDPIDASSDDDSSSSDSDDDQAQEPVDDGKLDRIELRVQANPSDITLHAEYIEELRKAREFTRLRTAREDLFSRLPLPKEQSLQWIEDESSIASSLEEKKAVMKVYEKALYDFDHVDLWLAYANYIITEIDDKDIITEALNRTLAHVGRHATKGHAAWDLYRSWRKSCMEEATEEREKNELKSRVTSLYRSQLLIPSSHHAQLCDEFSAWLSQNNEKEVKGDQKDKDKATERWKQMQSHESLIADTEEEQEDVEYAKVSEWLQYLDWAEKYLFQDIQLITSLFERALIIYPTYADLWIRYIDLVIRSLSVEDVVLTLHRRAMRSCPWSGVIVASYFRSLEEFKKEQEIEDTYNKIYQSVSLSGDTEWSAYFSAYIDYLRRKLPRGEDLTSSTSAEVIERMRTVYNDAITTLTSFYPQSNEPASLMKYMTRFEAYHVKDAEKSRKIYEELLTKEGGVASTWLLAIEIETHSPIAETKPLMSLLKRGSTFVRDDPQTIWNHWLVRERLEGTLQDWRNASETIGKKRDELNRQYIISALKVEGAARAKKEKKEKKNKEEKERKKRKIEEREEQKKEETQVKKRKQNESELHELTAFITGLPHAMKPEEVEQLFVPFGEIKEVRLMRDKDKLLTSGKHLYQNKGFGYIEFEQESSVQASITGLHETLVQGKKVKVTKARAPTSTLRERHPERDSQHSNTVFISQVHPSSACTEDNLRKLFGGCGDIKHVRVVFDRVTKQPKGFAFVDFENEEGVKEAVRLNDTQPEFCDPESRIRIAKSDPSRAQNLNSVPAKNSSAGTAVPPPDPNEPAPLMRNQRPRSLMLPKGKAAGATQRPKLGLAAAAATQKKEGEGNKSNEDFRNFDPTVSLYWNILRLDLATRFENKWEVMTLSAITRAEIEKCQIMRGSKMDGYNPIDSSQGQEWIVFDFYRAIFWSSDRKLIAYTDR
ncbi:squamous cell carcinoma antigen recognized by T-cells 3-like isoform 2 [Planoprotostelium fungivorum]|uniref:Squamous cell carcinoma antigen recognized by T-cells 3-like isoform 2 n=1 Tax=Planoprotostelium fungivorum TaxID=1890364 RepID=A0A2P6N1T6_9EUKA|nr:squamous cell carcinoma antigen recognized by T-cells 3-like isoform 2 [Planoprotostelium fungivorum]